MSSLTLNKVSKSFGALEIIRNIDLDIAAGEFVVFVGPSGCGKSTLLRLVAGLEPITSGDLLVGGELMTNTPAAQRGVAMVFQSYALYPHMTVYKNMSFGLETAGMPKAEIDQRVRRAANSLQIAHLLDRKPKNLSGGQRQRVAIGRAIVREPKIFLFDEPLSNLDAELRVQTRVEIAKLHNEVGATMIYVTHDQVEAMTLADRIVVLRAGVIEQQGTPLEIYNEPVNQFVAGFIGSPKMNFLQTTVGEKEGATATLTLAGTSVRLLRDPSLPVGSTLTLGLRPEHLMTGDDAGIALGNVLVDHVERLGGQTIAYGRLQDSQPLTIALDGQRDIAVGNALPISIAKDRYHLFGEDGKRIFDKH